MENSSRWYFISSDVILFLSVSFPEPQAYRSGSHISEWSVCSVNSCLLSCGESTHLSVGTFTKCSAIYKTYFHLVCWTTLWSHLATKGREENLWSSVLAFKKVREINYIIWVSLFKEQAAAPPPPAKILGLQQMKWVRGTWRAWGQPAKPLLLEAQFSWVYSRWFIPVGF